MLVNSYIAELKSTLKKKRDFFHPGTKQLQYEVFDHNTQPQEKNGAGNFPIWLYYQKENGCPVENHSENEHQHTTQDDGDNQTEASIRQKHKSDIPAKDGHAAMAEIKNPDNTVDNC